MVDATENLPREASRLKELLAKAELTQRRLSDAQDLYRQARAVAPDAAAVDRRMEEVRELLPPIDEILKTLRKQVR